MRPYLTFILRLICVVCFALLILRVWLGPVHGVITARSTLNIAAIGSFAALLSSSRTQTAPAGSHANLSPWLSACLLLPAAMLPYWRTLSSPFLFDDYVHLTTAAAEPFSALLHRTLLLHPTGGDGFFRPAGNIIYWLLFRVAGWNPLPWHLFGAFIHAANTLLVYFLLRKNSAAAWPSLAGALFFAWQGAHVEAVSWTAALFDLLAAFFCLVALLVALAPRRSSSQLLALIAASILACLSKESAYCLPLLIACLALLCEAASRRRILKNAAWAALACAATFAYRAWYLQGIGGYRTATGSPMLFSLHPLSILQALFLRLWGLLFLPVNWSLKPQIWLALALTAMLATLLIFVVRRAIPNATAAIYPALLFTLCAALPVFPLLSIGSDLSGARVLYLPSIGLSLFCCLVLASASKSPPSRIAELAVAAVLCFQLAALIHNESIWNHESTLATQICADVAGIQKQHPAAHIYVTHLPKIREGIFFLGNGFPQCVAQVGGDASRVTAGLPRTISSPNDYFLDWDDAAAKLTPHMRE